MHKSYAAAAAGAKSKPSASAAPPAKSSTASAQASPSTNGSKKPAKPKTNGKDTSASAAAPPGFQQASAAKRQASAAAGLSDQYQRVLRHRALFAFRFFVGKAVEIQLDDQSVYAGVLDCIDPDDFSVSASGEAFQSGSSVVFKRRQVVHLTTDGVINYNESAFGAPGAAAGAAGFRTDTEISGRQHEHLFGRELQAASSWLDPQLDSGELEDPRRRSSKSGWNQFEANEKLFGVVSTFDETLYTTKLDKSKISTQQSRDAERIAQEIERQMSSNFHLQEERGHAPQTSDELDEEARYSSVDRKNAKFHGKSANSYVPPALRSSQRQTSGGKSQPSQAKPGFVTTAAPTATAPPASKPLSFSDAVTGRTQTSVAAKSEQQEAAMPTSPKKAGTAAAAATPTSPEKKAAGTAVAKESTKATAAKAKTDVSPATKADKIDKAAATSTTPAKKGLNPNAKEFKFNVGAAEFTPKFATPPVTSSPFRGAQQPQQPQHHPHHPHQQHMGHLHHQPHPAVMYSPMPDEWMYEGAVGMEDPEMLAQGYLPYGVPMVPGMQPQVYPPHMLPQQTMRMMGGGDQRQHGGYGYQQPSYNARGYYPPNGAVPGMPYPGAVPVGVAAPQPPLPPREPSPHDPAGASSSAPPASPSLQPQNTGKSSTKK